jgi:5'-nucleotidase
MNRRSFIQRAGMTGLLAYTGGLPFDILARQELVKITILHTNDVHSRVDPFPMDGTRNAGQGGAARRAKLIASIRQQEEHVLLLDAGDIFQGTPYFNMFGGELEFKLMSEMKYDAATIGNHDFDAGIDGLAKQMPHATFPLIISNYDMEDTPMQGKMLDHKIFEKGGLKIGVFGLGIELESLVPQALYGNTRYQDPVVKGQEMATRLKQDEKCEYVICLSHLGFRYRSDKISDVTIAPATKDIDLILGGHTHTFMNHPEVVANLDGDPVYINQVGWAGLRLGRIDVHLERNKKNKCLTCENLWIGGSD